MVMSSTGLRLGLIASQLIGALAIFIVETTSVLAGSQDEHKWKEELEPALRKMETFFSEVRASALMNTTSNAKIKGMATPIGKIQAEVSLQRSAGAFKHSTKVVEPKGKTPERVYCRNPERYVFRLERPEGGSSFLVKDLWDKSIAYTEVHDIGPWRFLFVSHYVQGVPLSKILGDRSFVVNSMSVKDGVANLNFNWSPSNEPTDNHSSGSVELWFSVEKGWAIEKYRMRAGARDSKASSVEGIVEYDRMENGVAIPKRVFEVHGGGSSVEVLFPKIEHAVSNKNDFTLTYYGLPEPMGMRPVDAGGRHWYLWIALAALGSLGLAVFFWKMKRHVQTSGVVTP
jgi:hypothetical protein